MVIIDSGYAEHALSFITILETDDIVAPLREIALAGRGAKQTSYDQIIDVSGKVHFGSVGSKPETDDIIVAFRQAACVDGGPKRALHAQIIDALEKMAQIPFTPAGLVGRFFDSSPRLDSGNPSASNPDG